MRQTDLMRRLVSDLGFDEDAVPRAYAAAEQRGEVKRLSNKNGLTAMQYARALYRDGILKGWLRSGSRAAQA